jgi:hypothetical protein
MLGLTAAVIVFSSWCRDGRASAANGPPKTAAQVPAPLPAAEFFSVTERARSFAYVVDRSGSMASRGKLDFVKRELSRRVTRLTIDARFSVNFYDLNARFLNDAKGLPGLMAATEENKAAVYTQIDATEPEGGTDHVKAVRLSLREKPEVVFFLTDADLVFRDAVPMILAEAGRARIHVAEFGNGPADRDVSPLRRLADASGGTYHYFDITNPSKPGPKGAE